MSVIDVTVQVVDTIDSIAINYDNQITSIALTEVIPQIQLIQTDIGGQPNIITVNGLVGVVTLTHTATLTYVAPSSGVYTYTVTHNLGHSTPVVVVYNGQNEEIVADVTIVDQNTVTIKSASDMTGFKVVIQR